MRQLDEEKLDIKINGKRNNMPLVIGISLIVFLILGVGFYINDRRSMANTNASDNSTLIPKVAGTADSNIKIITMETGSFFFKPTELRVEKDKPVKLVITNTGGIHDFVIDELGVKSKVVRDGENLEVVFTPNKTGTFEFYCSIANHRQMGMKGTIVVE